MTWGDVARHLPEFVAWCVARHGPLPEGEVVEADFERLRHEWAESAAARQGEG